MRSLRLVAAVGLGLSPLLGSMAAGTVPAFAGGGAGMTVFATMEGEDQRLLAGTRHLVTIIVSDTPGEADLRNITVDLVDMEPQSVPVTCPAGVNGQLSLEPEQSLQCTAVVTAKIGYQTLITQVKSQVPGGGSLERSVTLHYTGFLPPPPPPPPPPPAPAVVQPAKPLVSGAAADARPHPHPEQAVPPPPPPLAPVPVVAGVAPPVGAVSAAPQGSSPAEACPDGSSSGSSSGSGSGSSANSSSGSRCGQPAPASIGTPRKRGGGLPFTGMSAPLLATAAGAALVLIAGGALLVRRVARR